MATLYIIVNLLPLSSTAFSVPAFFRKDLLHGIEVASTSHLENFFVHSKTFDFRASEITFCEHKLDYVKLVRRKKQKTSKLVLEGI